MQTQINRGEIWLTNIGEGVGSVQGGMMRPMIIISNPMCCKFSPVLHSVPTTSQPKRWMPTHVEIPTSSGLLKKSTALVEQTMLLPKEAYIKCIGYCESNIMDKIDDCIAIQFGIVQTDRNNVQYA